MTLSCIPDGPELVALRDAGDYITSLPKAEQNLDAWHRASISLNMPINQLVLLRRNHFRMLHGSCKQYFRPRLQRQTKKNGLQRLPP